MPGTLRPICLSILSLLVRASNEFGTQFLEANKRKDAVISHPSGLQYKILRAGTGSDHPTANSACACHYEGRIAENYPSGQKFDSSYDRGSPTTFAPNQVIKGWTIAMQLMVEGDKWEMYIPSELAYGDQGMPPRIPGGAVLVFTMEIIKIKGDRKPASKQLETVKSPAQTEASGKKEENSEQSVTLALRPSSNLIVFDVANLVGEPSEGSFTLEIHPDWAPVGAKRMKELVQAKFFDNVRFFRVIDRFMAQFGIHGDPSVMRKWANKNILDDKAKPGVGNRRGTVSFAMAGPNTRSTQFFINFVDNGALDGMGFTPIGEVVEGMDVVDRLFKVGEGAPSGPGPSQGLIQAEGNAYLNLRFPELSYVKSCRARNVPADIAGSGGNLRGSEEVATTTPASPGMQDLGNGLKLFVQQPGDGKTFPKTGDLLTMHYTLTLAADTSGAIIDSSRTRNEPFTFTIGRGQVIRGWDEGIMKMSLGQRGVLAVPSALGYREMGAGDAIPPNADLRFDVELLGIGDKFSSAGLESTSKFNLIGVLAFVIIIVVLGACYWTACRGPTQKHVRRTIEMSLPHAE
eukprot:TRINITY_DN90975_c0_g1_i1.p1 TRINITY_DN90975_c0_g1~~TRINITY_DN90975_c0_g1_i1.p1  ORF type:complete len:574 (+),score=74.70 TRINITY_DN90975_c0_g1_i1:68-1789(+)